MTRLVPPFAAKHSIPVSHTPSTPQFLTRLMMVACLLARVAFGQQGGVPVFGASDVHDVDTIDLTTLTPILNIPVPRTALTAQQTCANHPSGIKCSGSAFSANAASLLGYISHSIANRTCPSGTKMGVNTNYAFTSLDGLTSYQIDPGLFTASSTCPTSISNAKTIDGSGLTLSINDSGNGTLTDANGNSVTISAFNVLNGTETDPFGNTISYTVSTPPPAYDSTYTFNTALNTSTVWFQPAANTHNPYFQWTDTNGHSQQVLLIKGSTLTTYTWNSSTCATTSHSLYPISQISFPDGTSMNITMEQGPGGAGTSTGRIQSFTLRTGATISYTYASACPLPGLYATLSRTTPDGTTTYQMQPEGPSAYFSTTVIDPGKNKTVYHFMPGESALGYPNNGLVVLVGTDIYQNTGTVASPVYTLISSITTCYNGNQSNCRTSWPYFPITQRDRYTTITGMSASSRVSETFDSYGNRTSVASYDFGASSFTTKTTTTYGSWNGSSCVAVGSNINSLPCDVVTTDNASHTLAESRVTYNSHGFPTQTQQWTGSSWLTSSATPNTNGTVATSTAPNGQVTNYSYAATGSGGCNGLLLTGTSTTVNSVNLTTGKTWDCNGGVVLTTTDPNGNGTVKQYDSMFRPTLYQDQTGYQTAFAYASNYSQAYSSFTGVKHDVIEYVDGLGRVVNHQVQQGPNSSNFDTVSTAYQWNGTNFQTTTSAACTQILGQNATCPTTVLTTLSNPAFGPIGTTDVNGGTTTYARNQNDASLTAGPKPASDANVKTVQTEVDGLGRTKSTCALQPSGGGTSCGQVMGGSGVLTSSSYSFGTGSSTTTTARGAQTHTTVTDALGRVTSVTTPEAGTVTYYYDSIPSQCYQTGANVSGQLTAIKDNGGNFVCPEDDGLGRTIAVGSGSYCKRFLYDTTTGVQNSGGTLPSGYPNPTSTANIIGRLVEAETDNCNTPRVTYTDEFFAYDKDGRMTDMWESTPNSGGYYHTTVTYNPDGSLATLSGIPYFPTFTFGVDGEGRGNSLTRGTTAVISSTAGSGFLYDAASRILNVPVGALGDQNTFTYDVLEHMTGYAFNVNGTSMVGSLTWNPIGSLKTLSITDGFNANGSQTCNFGYDDIARLTTDNCGSVWNQTYSYDQYDNLTKAGSISWNPGYTSSNQMIGSTYDSMGRVLYDGVNTYTWDTYGKMSSVNPNSNSQAVCGTSGACDTYDAFGRQVVNQNQYGAANRIYSAIGLSGYAQNGLTEAMFDAPGNLFYIGGYVISTGVFTDTVVNKDWVNTSRLHTTITTRSEQGEEAISPYGDEYVRFGGIADTFAGILRLTTQGLFDSPNRIIMGASGRWLSPDPAHASWNAYAYPTDPNTMTDPSGAMAWAGLYPVGQLYGDDRGESDSAFLWGLDASRPNTPTSKSIAQLKAENAAWMAQENADAYQEGPSFTQSGYDAVGREIAGEFWDYEYNKKAAFHNEIGAFLWSLWNPRPIQINENIIPVAGPIVNGILLFCGPQAVFEGSSVSESTGLYTIRMGTVPESLPAVSGGAPGVGFPELLDATPVGSALKGASGYARVGNLDSAHAAAFWMRGYAAKNGTVFPFIDSSGNPATLIQVLGDLNGAAGRYEYIVNHAGNLTHEWFVKGGTINGIPIQP